MGKKFQVIRPAGYPFIWKKNLLLVMNRELVFNLKNTMNMHKGYTYQIYNYGCLKKKLQEYNVALRIKPTRTKYNTK